MVTDPHLDKHLRHWGINMMQVGGGVHFESFINCNCVSTIWGINMMQVGVNLFI